MEQSNRSTGGRRKRSRAGSTNPFRGLVDAALVLDEQYREERARIDRTDHPEEVKKELQDELAAMLAEQIRILRDRSRAPEPDGKDAGEGL